MKVISVCNHKGGCAKTTTVVNIAAELVNSGYRVLIIDNDYQANLTTSVGFKPDNESLINCLRGKKSLRKSIKKCSTLDGLDIIPNNSEVSNADLALIKMRNCKRILNRLIEEENLKDDYDFILIDCPPTQSITTINALVASDSVIIPMEPSLFNMQGLKNLSRTIKLTQKTFNKKLKVEGILLTRVDSRTKLSENFRKEIKESYSYRVFETEIHQSSVIVKSQTSGLPVSMYDPKSKSTKEYRSVTDEILNTAFTKNVSPVASIRSRKSIDKEVSKVG
ncbi:ParA family protein [Clostridium sp.]|jgi:chromosome partitioning protein|uniref:ParA family protein n=1 Tax=Clostridium sp. TaxID=1506 RepID=UPI0025BB1A09|nr:ParA family protein [Clostridium sp.]MCI9304544.1 ParA family protein [Clostridium sp.]